MRRGHATLWAALAGAASVAAAVVTATLPARPAAAAAAAISDGPKRVDFDDRLIRGQRHGAGTVYIFQREKVEMRSMVNRPRSFRQRIVASVFRD